MSVRTTVLENGRWVTRDVDPYHIRAQNPETRRKEQSRPSINFPEKPSMGILTKTLVRSPVINRIIPARVRHKTMNDVLFISATSVTIKEAKGDYALHEIATKSDFDSTIKSARIIGEQRELTRDDSSFSLLRNHKYWLNLCANEYDDQLDQRDLQHHATLEHRELPPQILVLALESDRLVFLCAVSGSAEHPELFTSQKALPAPTSPLQSLGELIAVDPHSRAMAVAAHEGRAYVYVLKSMDEMRAEFRESSRLEPIKEEKLLVLDGSIMKMEFLHPPEGEPNRVILLLIVAKDYQSRMILYDWDGDMTLRQAQLKPSKIRLSPDEQLPWLLIPLLKNSAFILVCENRIVLIKDVLTGSFDRYHCDLAYEQESQEPGASRRRPIWVQWARPMRSRRLRPNEENIVLCREDGIVQYMVIDHGIKHMIDSNHNIGKLGVNISTSFAIVDLGPNTDDLLVVGGDESDGGLWDFPPRQAFPNQRGIMPNWTPISDFYAANVPIDRQDAVRAANNASKRQQRLFACFGRGKHGAISEIRYGVEASQKIATVIFSEEFQIRVLGVWALHDIYANSVEKKGDDEYLEHVTLFILAHALGTRVLQLRQRVDLSDAVVGEISHDVGLDLCSKTIAVGRTTQGLIIQITESSIRATSLPLPIPVKDDEIKKEDTEDRKPDKDQLDVEISQSRYMYQSVDLRILAACIHAAEHSTIIVLATQRNGHFYVECGTFTTEYQPLDQRISLLAQPSCIYLLVTEDEILILVGTTAGELEVYPQKNISFGLLNTVNTICHAFAGPFGICDSIATIERATTRGMQPVLVCGLRDGAVETFELSKGVGTYQLILCEKITFGHTSLTVLEDTTTNRAIIQCGKTLCTLQYPANVDKAPATVLNVWTTDPNELSLQQAEVSAIRQVIDCCVPGVNPRLTAGSFVWVDRNRLHTISLNTQPNMVPHRVELGGSPVKVLYSTILDKVIVLYHKMDVLRAPRQINGRSYSPARRALRPIVSFLDSGDEPVTKVKEPVTKTDPNAMDIDREEKFENSQALPVPNCKPEEKFLGITEWFPKIRIGDNPYHIFVFNTTFPRAGKPAGRLLFFTVVSEQDKERKREEDGAKKKARNRPPLKLLLKKAVETDEPVYSVATYSNMSLVYCVGNDLYMQSLGVEEPSRIKLQDPIKIAMRSPARYITVKEPYIYVSSSRESLSVYRYSAGHLVYHFGDQHARAGLHHLALPYMPLVLASDMAGTVVGLWQPPERRMDNAMMTVFEAVLPASITRLRRISRPVWSRAGSRKVHESKVDRQRLFGDAPSSSSSLLLPSLKRDENDDGDETILGSSADGTLTQMSLLSSDEWRLLRFIQNMAERDPRVRPSPRRHHRHIEPSTARPHHMHVDGDILEKVIELGGDVLIEELLDKEPSGEGHTDFDSSGERRGRFEELARRVMGAVGAVEGEGVVEEVVVWVRYLLRSAL